MLSFFQLDVLDEIWDVIESVSEGFLTYSYCCLKHLGDFSLKQLFDCRKPDSCNCLMQAVKQASQKLSWSADLLIRGSISVERRNPIIGEQGPPRNSISLSLSHRPIMTEILLKRT